MIRLGSYAVGTALLVMMAPMAAVAQDEHAGHHPPAGVEAPATPPGTAKPADDQRGMMSGSGMSSGMMHRRASGPPMPTRSARPPPTWIACIRR